MDTLKNTISLFTDNLDSWVSYPVLESTEKYHRISINGEHLTFWRDTYGTDARLSEDSKSILVKKKAFNKAVMSKFYYNKRKQLPNFDLAKSGRAKIPGGGFQHSELQDDIMRKNNWTAEEYNNRIRIENHNRFLPLTDRISAKDYPPDKPLPALFPKDFPLKDIKTDLKNTLQRLRLKTKELKEGAGMPQEVPTAPHLKQYGKPLPPPLETTENYPF